VVASNRSRVADVQLVVDWAPAYELVLSWLCFTHQKLHPRLDLGPAWLKDVRRRLPPDFTIARPRGAAKDRNTPKDEHDLLLLLARACPVGPDAAAFVTWLAQLTPGAAYEALAPRVPDAGPRLPRDFSAWRDPLVSALGVWDSYYFSTIHPDILSGLDHEADSLKAQLPSPTPLQLVEQVTNGLCVEPTPDLRQITLIPQYHERPYNHQSAEQGNIILFYPADVLSSTAEDRPPSGLLRLTRALSDESRLRILRFLANGPRTLTAVARFAGLSQPTVHHHLAQLRVAGLVRIHFTLSGSTRYSLRQRALDQLAQQLGAYLGPITELPPDHHQPAKESPT
jgi:DNA-binding transcriptional ArsR family regulator